MSTIISDRLMHQAGMARIPISGTFELTPMCNFACKMCYIRKNSQEVAECGGLLPKEQWLAWAREAKEQGMLYLLITGGEPLTYPGFWELYEELTHMGFVISINSNGSMITEEAAKRFQEMPPRRINITLYGASGDSYHRLCNSSNGFARVLQGADLLQKYGINFRFNCSLTPYNSHEFLEVREIAKRYGVPLELATYMFPPVRREADLEAEHARLSAKEAGFYTVEQAYLQLSEEEFLVYAKNKMSFEKPMDCVSEQDSAIKKAMGCRAGRCSFWVDWQGNLSPCGMINNPRYSIRENSFLYAWNRIVEDVNAIRCLAGCASCKNKGLCHTCIATAFCETGDINGRPTYVCKMIEAEAEACRQKLQQISKV